MLRAQCIQTAGLTVAGRIAENPELSVAVLEAGPALLDDPIISECFLYLFILDLLNMPLPRYPSSAWQALWRCSI